MVRMIKFLLRFLRHSSTKLCLIILLVLSSALTVIFYYELVTLPLYPGGIGSNAKVYNIKSDDLMSQYCNTPSEMKSEVALPAAIIKQYQLTLLSVVVLARHGDRAPLRPVKRWRKINYKGTDADQSTLSQKFKISTSQKTVPLPSSLSSYSNLAGYEHPTLGQLSWLGSLQHLKLGRMLYEAYNDKVNLQEFEAHTTAYERTYQSAAALLFGLIEPLVPTSDAITLIRNKLKITKSALMCFDYCSSCPRLFQLQRKLDQVKNASLEMKPALLSSMRKLITSVVTIEDSDLLTFVNGSFDKGKGFSSPEAVLDGISAFICHNERLPCASASSSSSECASHGDVNNLVTFIASYYKALSSNEHFYLSNLLKSRGLLSHVSHLLKNTNGFKLLMAHDITLAPVTNVLGLLEGPIPGYANRLTFQAYTSSSGKRLLRLLYNGRDVTATSNLCSSGNSDTAGAKASNNECEKFISTDDDSVYTLVPIDKMEIYIVRKLVQLANTDSYEKACSYVETERVAVD